MSRCLPFPPPGYVKNGVEGEALLKLLELGREKALSKNKRKERRKKKKRRKHRGNEDEEVRKKRRDDDRKHKEDRSINPQGNKDKNIGRKHENPVSGLENSTLTEELGQPIIPVDVYEYDCCHKSELAPTFGKEKSSTSPSQSQITVNNPHKMDSKCDTYLGGCLMGNSEFAPNANFETCLSTFSSGSGMLEIESEYRKLIVNWVPPPLQMVQTDFDDEEWLSKKNLPRSEGTQTKHVSSASGNGIYQGIQPYAQYLPDADMYALPYTIPF